MHALEHACFVGFGIAMWMALLGPLPKPDWFGNGARLVYVIVVRFGGAVLANVLLWAGSPLYPDYAPGEATHGISPLADQGAAGVVMMVEQGLVTMGLFAWLFFRAAQQSDERQALLDLAAERGVPLDEARAARAVAAGQGERLRERIAAGRAVPSTSGHAREYACARDATASRVRSLAARDRFLAWLVTGPVGRFVAFVLDLAAALARGATNRLRRR